jgi:hypothetical protein
MQLPAFPAFRQRQISLSGAASEEKAARIPDLDGEEASGAYNRRQDSSPDTGVRSPCVLSCNESIALT